MAANCIFCRIIAGEIPSPRVFEDDRVVVIRDLHPQAREHFLVLPKTHVASLAEAFEDDGKGRAIVGDLFSAADRLVKQEGLLPEGYRSVLNTGEFGGQTVFHLHLHILGGEQLKGRFA